MDYVTLGLATVAAGVLSTLLSGGSALWAYLHRPEHRAETEVTVRTGDGRTVSITGTTREDILGKLSEALKARRD